MNPSPDDLKRLGIELGELVAEKNQAYGSAFATVGPALELLYGSEGIPADRLEDALLLTRLWDKMMRIATRKDAFGESPWRDIAGYGLLGAARDEAAVGRREALLRRARAGEPSLTDLDASAS